jgi:hypothetical protein
MDGTAPSANAGPSIRVADTPKGLSAKYGWDVIRNAEERTMQPAVAAQENTQKSLWPTRKWWAGDSRSGRRDSSAMDTAR